MASWDRVGTVLCDLDGVIWLAHRPIPGAVDAITRIRATGRRVLFVTNNSMALQAENELALASVGIPAEGSVVSSAIAAAELVAGGERVLVAAGPGVVEAVERRGAEVVVNDGSDDASDCGVVIVGLHRDFDYRRLATASNAVRRGARFIGTNADSTYPTPHGLRPGGGAILAAVTVAAGVQPVVAGKPHQPMASVIARHIEADTGRFDPDAVLMVGDRMDTDGLFAEQLGCRFALVRSGVTPPGDPVRGTATADRAQHAGAAELADLAAVADRLVG